MRGSKLWSPAGADPPLEKVWHVPHTKVKIASCTKLSINVASSDGFKGSEVPHATHVRIP